MRQVAKQLNMSTRTLNRLLKENGCTYRNLLKQVRIQKAMQLLKQGKMSITEIGHYLGYADTASFTKAFKSQQGVSPSQFINHM